MKQALQIAIDYMNDRLEDHDCKYQRHPATEAERINILADIETVKEALDKQEQGEPVAWRWQMSDVHPHLWEVSEKPHPMALRSEPLYTTPQQRPSRSDMTWVGLTDEEQIALLKDSDGKTRHWLVWQVEDKLKEKNT